MKRSYIDQARLWHTLGWLSWAGLAGGLVTGLAWLSVDRPLPPDTWLLLLAGGGSLLLLCGIVSATAATRALHQASNGQVLRLRQDFEALYTRSPVAYLTVESNGDIKRANPAAVHLLGGQINSIDTHNLYGFMVVEGLAGTDSSSVLRGKIASGLTLTDVELPIQTLTGTNRWVLVNVYRADQPHERLVSITDITDQRAVDTAKSEFVALATHQLRTPIAAIRWNVELLIRSLKDTQTDKQARYLTKIDRNVVRTLNLINDFLSVSKLEMGTFAADLETVEFKTYLEQILEEFEEKITNHQLQVNVTVEPQSLHVSIDRRLFHIISSNLISNAVKYTPTGGTVTISAVEKHDTLVFQVYDTGIGIPKNEQAELFTKFFRATNAQQQVTEGTGLGLYVVKQSIEILGGTLQIESEENKGTTFVVELPGVVRQG